MKKAVFFDIDGTLINMLAGQYTMRPAVRKAIGALREAGHYTFISSGRPYLYLDRDIIESQLFDGYVLMNGALVLLEGEVIHHQPLPKKTVADVVKLCEEHGVEYTLEGLRDIYLPKESPLSEAFTEAIHVPLSSFTRSFDVQAIDVYKMEFIAREDGAGGLFEKFIAFPGLTGVIDKYHAKNMEVYSDTETKATGILHALEALSIPVAESYAFGDGMNDLEMMETVGTGLAMGNAREAVKERATHIVPPVGEDGVATGIYEYILKE